METIMVPTEADIKRWIKEAFQECFEQLQQGDTGLNITEPEQLLNRKEIAGMLRVSLVTLHEWMKTGLPFTKQGGRVYFLQSEVMRYLKKQQGKVRQMYPKQTVLVKKRA
ncbi:hypothetical protein HNQ91_000671 [Filimonas zeae]|uniref:Helix-turn-helix domain-containing protein n=1 Tax=Filimonas zeae TaxID=1737353 RepID=A0A917MRV0_9BACT|nr:helix-turn-helix domain-containing protein [Filimonas zeae]MDR6337649.1 hypothetical protein [Filimonas zeae]GGH59629.1 hypothetical protein GCM10011379_06610 [Filimonas zeae]